MTTYAAFLGNHPHMSLAELRCRIPDFKLVQMMTPTVALFSSEQKLTNDDLRTWGGVFLLAREVSGSHSLENVPAILAAETEKVKGKVTFSIRAFGVEKELVHRLYRDCKHLLKKKGVPSRYIGNERKSPVSAQLRDAGLLSGKEGAEIVVLAKQDDDNEFLWIGRTIAAQDPDAYTKRDMKKPVRDTRAGMFPPKLAQMLLNMGEWVARDSNPKLGKTLTVFDPFCGTGVVPMEALLRNWPVLASDSSVKAVNGCEKNLEWIRKEEKILKKDVASTIWKQDATKAFPEYCHPKHSRGADVIVTETALGPALTARPTAKDAAKMKTECDALEIAFLKNVAETLPGVPVVATFPIWYVKSGPVFLEKTWNMIHDLGFTPVLPTGIEPDGEHLSLIYRRPDQFVGREVVILKPKKV